MRKYFVQTRQYVIQAIFLLFVGISNVHAQSLLALKDYGIENAKSGIERYEIILKVHKKAVKQGKGVTYQGLKSLSIEIPHNPQSIPLPVITDFAGVTLDVVNTQKTFHLYTMQGSKNVVEVTKKQIKSGNFRSVKELKNGIKVLILEDGNPWIRKRIGYDVGVTRKDIIYIKNGRAKNKPVQSYATDATKVKAYWYEGNPTTRVIKNLVFQRSENSTKEAYLIRLDGQDNVKISNISVITPPSNMYADQIISITDCCNVICEDIKINGTYSQKDKYGYGISMNNVWNSIFDRIDAHGNWGVFGTYNVNHSVIKNSSINRFDIHCYGKDIYIENCEFSDLYNQFSSVYGEIVFTGCTFRNFTPLLIEASFNAYTPFDVIWRDCVFYLDKNHSYLMHLGGLTDVENERDELKEKHLPNITVDGCKVIVLDGVKEWNVLQTGEINGLSHVKSKANIKVKNMAIEGRNTRQVVVSDDELIESRLVKIKVN